MVKIEDLKLLSRYDSLQKSYDEELHDVLESEGMFRESEWCMQLLEAIKKDKKTLRERAMSLVEVLDKCSNLTRQVIDLKFIQRLEIDEIASILHIARRTVYRYIENAVREFEDKQQVSNKIPEKPYEFKGFTL